MPFDKGKKRKLIDTCGHERCYACMFRNEACPICARKSQGRKPVMERYTPSPQRLSDPEWQSPLRLPKPPKQTSTLAQSCPTPPHTRRRFFLSPKSLRSPFGQRSSRHSQENHVPLSGLPEEGPRSAAWTSLVFNKIRSLWSAHSSTTKEVISNKVSSRDARMTSTCALACCWGNAVAPETSLGKAAHLLPHWMLTLWLHTILVRCQHLRDLRK
ncbi:unnamed protein product [Leptidea sinapis]|uniref:RING-type domain-containing protein n=1 Tax=Leptidea sinapis TaxID=189913 RepID=A0A5E4R416_9NEOP|nr:unnamed protein product [Leptidea sinapis]